MKLQEDVKKNVEALKKIKGVEGIYLFGSSSKGKNTPISDIDICVVTGKISKKERAEILSLGSEKMDISLFHELPIYIRFRVIGEGRPLYEKNKPVLSHIFAMTLSRYQEFRPTIRRYYEKAHGIKI